MATETPSMKHLVVSSVAVRPSQNQVKEGFVKMQLICRDSTAESGRTPVFFTIKAVDDVAALAAAKAKYRPGDEIAARKQTVVTANEETVDVWQLYATTEEVNREEYLNDRAAQLRLSEAKTMAAIAPRQYTEEQLADRLG